MESTVPLLTTQQAATALGLQPPTIRRAIRDNKLAAHLWGRQWVIEPDAIEAYRLNHLGNKGWATARRNKGVE